MKFLILATVLALFTTSCTTVPLYDSHSGVSNFGAEKFAGPQASIFRGDSTVASDAEISRALDYEYDPSRVKAVALLPCGDLGPELIGNEEKIFRQIQQANPDLEFVSIPKILLPSPLTAAQLRSIAARLQADTVVLYQFRKHYTYQSHVFSRDEAEFWVTLEYYLFDIRSGVIPHAGALDQRVESKRSNDAARSAYIDENFRGISTQLIERMSADLSDMLAKTP